jgi:hypothetical protein
MPCGQPATRQITTRSAWLQDAVRSEGGWDAYRAHALHDGENDPGEDPGEEKWGDDVELLCSTHAQECRDNAGQDAPYDYSVIADETLLPVTEEERKARERLERFLEEQDEERRISRAQ